MNTLRTRCSLLLPVLLLLFIGGCQTIANKQSNIELEKVLNSYHTTVRWGNPEQAYIFLKPESFPDLEIPSDLDNIRVTGYEVIQQPTPLSEELVNQTARISYVLKDRQIERTLMDRQVWEYQAEHKIWYRINPIPEYK